MKNTIAPEQLIVIAFMLVTFSSCVPSASTSSSKILKYSDLNYSKDVGIVILRPTSPGDQFANPISLLGRSMTLEFDLLRENYSYLTAKVFYCNADWSPSILADLEFLTEFNEFQINDYSFSQGTVVPYVSYSLQLPNVTKTGNYVIAVSDKNGILLTRRFMVYQQLSDIKVELTRPTVVSERQSHHQVEFEVSYGSLEVNRPSIDITPVLLQNHNWNTAIAGLKPTGFMGDNSRLQYNYFDGENSFAAGNEFRLFDIRTLANRGLQVQRVGKSNRGIEVQLQPEASRKGNAYSENFHEDLNGNFRLGNQDWNENTSQSEYVYVNFSLSSKTNPGPIFLTGKFNNWRLDQKILYDSTSQSYEGSVLFKQGYYNYMYWLQSSRLPFHYMEGSHFQTTNEYELLVYYREPGTVFDQLIGYQRF